MNMIPSIKSVMSKALVLSPFLGIFFCWFSISQCNENQRLRQEKANNKERVVTATKIIERYIDTSGSEHTVVQDNGYTREQVNDLLKNDRFINDTLVKALNIAKNRIEELTRINGTLLIASQGKGTPQGTVDGHDKWLNWSYNPKDSMLNATYNMELNHVRYPKQHTFLGIPFGKDRDINYLDLYSPDSRLTINKVDRFRLIETEPAFGFKVESKLLYNFGDQQMYPGLSAELKYKRYGLGADYLFDLSQGKPITFATIKYKLFEL